MGLQAQKSDWVFARLLMRTLEGSYDTWPARELRWVVGKIRSCRGKERRGASGSRWDFPASSSPGGRCGCGVFGRGRPVEVRGNGVFFPIISLSRTYLVQEHTLFIRSIYFLQGAKHGVGWMCMLYLACGLYKSSLYPCYRRGRWRGRAEPIRR